MGSYNNKGITVIIVIHVIHFKGLQDNGIAVIGKKDKSQRGNYQINVLVLTVCDDESWIEGVPNYSSVFSVGFSPPQCHSRIQTRIF